MDAETKCWAVRWKGTRQAKYDDYYMNKDRRFKNMYDALRKYHHIVNKGEHSAHLVKISVDGTQKVIMKYTDFPNLVNK
jgi:hypothetical protein